MKKYIFLFAFLSLALAGVAFATPTTWDFTNSVLQPLKSQSNNEVRVPWLVATSTTATSTFAAGQRLAGGLSLTQGLEAPFVVASSTTGISKFEGQIAVATATPWGKVAIEQTGTDPVQSWSDTANDTTPSVIEANGDVGIGVANPLGKFEVATVTTRTAFSVTDQGRIGIGIQNPTATLVTIAGPNSTAGITRFCNSNCTEPWLDISNVNTDAAGNGRVTFYRDAVNAGNIGASAGNSVSLNGTDFLDFSTQGITSVRFTKSRLFGVGDTDPDAELEVSANATTTGGDIFLLSTDDNTDGDILTVTVAGSVGIGTTTPSNLFSVQGNAFISGTTTTGQLHATSTALFSGKTKFLSVLEAPAGIRWGEYNDFVVGVLGRKSTTTTIVNSTAETTVFSWEVPANTMGSDRMLRFMGHGAQEQNNGSTLQYTIRMKFGGVTILEDTTGGMSTTTAHQRAIDMNVRIGNTSTSQQTWGGNVTINPATTSFPPKGHWDLGVDENNVFTPLFATSSIDTTVDNVFEITIQQSVAHPAATTTFDYGILEIL